MTVLLIGLLAFLALILTIKLDKKKVVNDTNCQQCDDEYGNCWKCTREEERKNAVISRH
jgi:hypothetical protein